jgi:hypothetical protein
MAQILSWKQIPDICQKPHLREIGVGGLSNIYDYLNISWEWPYLKFALTCCSNRGFI